MVLLIVCVLSHLIVAPLGADGEPPPHAVDAVSMASPDREAIWTARLFFIAVNDRDADTLYALFTDDAMISVDEVADDSGIVLPAAEVGAATRRAWLERSVVKPGIRLRNRGGEVDGRTVTVRADWSVGDTHTTVAIEFEQSDDGRIATMRIAPARE